MFLVCVVFTLFYSLCSARELSESNLTQSFISSRSQVFGNQIEDPFSMVSDNILFIILMMISPSGVIIEFYLFLSFFQGERLRQQVVDFTDPPLIKDRKVSE